MTLRHHRSQVILGRTVVADLTALARLGAEARVTLDAGDGVRSYRVHGHAWDREGDELVGTLWVAV